MHTSTLPPRTHLTHARLYPAPPLMHGCAPQEPFEYYLKASGHGAEAKCLAAFDKFGMNKFEVPIPPFGELLKEHMLAPFFCFQVGARV